MVVFLLTIMLGTVGLPLQTDYGRQAAGPVLAAGESFSTALPGDGAPPESRHHHVVRKKPRQLDMVVVSRGEESATVLVILPAWGAIVLVHGSGDVSRDPIPAMGPVAPVFRSAPQLRLHPGPAPPLA